MGHPAEHLAIHPEYAFKKPRRITITVADSTFAYLVDRSTAEGRSLSNLCAFLLESATAAAITPFR